MPDRPNKEFGSRRPPAVRPPAAPVKRSGHVALLLMGTVAVGSGAYALMPSENNCQPNRPGIAASPGQPNDCAPRSSSSSSGGGHGYSGGSSSRSSFFSGDSSSTSSSSGSSSGSSEGGVSRGGFGSFAHAFSSHFSGGG
jgi:hypothetical protein